MGTNEDSTVHRNVPCPFCGLVCDDLTVSVQGEAVEVLERGCERSKEGFRKAAAAPYEDGEAMIGGKPASLEDAVGEAARLLKQSRFPLISGLGAEGQGIRAAIQLADRLNGAVDHLHGDALMNHVHTLQDSGWVTTTLTELRNRADLVVVLGTPLLEHVPRLFERFIRPEEGLFPDRLDRRRVVAVGAPETAAAPGDIDESLACDPAAIGDVAEALRALLNGHDLQAEEVAGIRREALARLAEELRNADYGVVAWSADAMEHANRDLTVGSICGLVRDLNETTRCAGLALGGEDGAQTALQATTWQTGFPVRVQFRGGYPQYDPIGGGTRDLLASGDPDALVWISALNSQAHPPATDVPTVVLGQSGMKPTETPAVLIPVGTPGVDHGGPLFRTDGGVSLPLRALRTAPVPSVGEVLARIESQL
ncbi:formylmethanofuran dehydrogenase subunit B [Thiohalorhabdus methylotrophus]|uniref:Formylmethanofuran dehydrogenase subunit B n=1 Tax=Thiohalorhabdus methylotrophus TaxID=3242694 RepID=A0ABV4TVQ5_9GAMM